MWKKACTRISLCMVAAVFLLNSVDVFAASDMIVSKPRSNDSHLYLGVKAGNASYDNVDDSDVSLDLFLGYQLDELLSVQGGFATLGEPVNGLNSAEVTLIHGEIVASIAIKSDLSLYGQAGLFAWEYDTTRRVGFGSRSESDSGVDVTFGVGIDYKVSSRYAVRFALDIYSLEPEVFAGKVSEDIINYSVGVKLNL